LNLGAADENLGELCFWYACLQVEDSRFSDGDSRFGVQGSGMCTPGLGFRVLKPKYRRIFKEFIDSI
jgi:hypothetical protein